MKFVKITLVLCLYIMANGIAFAARLSHTLRPTEAIKSSLRSTHINKINKTPIKGLYEVVAGRNIFYSGSQGRYLIFGHIYDLKTQTDLTATAQQSLLPKPTIKWNKLPHSSAIVANPKAKLKLAVFVDPDCPYCRALESVLVKLKHVQIHYYLNPLGQLHPNAPYQSAQIWCSKNRLSTLETIMSGRSISLRPACNLSALKNIKTFSRLHHINMTPTLVREDGKVTYGYLDKKHLLSWLKASTLRKSS